MKAQRPAVSRRYGGALCSFKVAGSRLLQSSYPYSPLLSSVNRYGLFRANKTLWLGEPTVTKYLYDVSASWQTRHIELYEVRTVL